MRKNNNNIRSTCLGETVSMSAAALVRHYKKKAENSDDEHAKHIYLQHAEHYKKK